MEGFYKIKKKILLVIVPLQLQFSFTGQYMNYYSHDVSTSKALIHIMDSAQQNVP